MTKRILLAITGFGLITLATGWGPTSGASRSTVRGGLARARALRAAADDSSPHPEAPQNTEAVAADDDMQKEWDSVQLSQFNNELYAHLGKRSDYETSELYSSLKRRVDVDDPLYSELSARREMLESNPASLPTADQTPGEVIETVLRALRDVDWPHPAHGIEVLRNYSGIASILGDEKKEEVTAQMLLEYFEESRYRILLEWVSIQYLKKLELSLDRKRALQQIRLKSATGESIPVTFQLSKYMRPEGEVWLSDQLLVKTAR